jgi:ribonuclease VapC
MLDSSALIALMRGEPGSEVVRAALPGSLICAVNLTESMTKLIRQGAEPKLVEHYLRALSLDVVPWDEELAWESRDLCPLAWSHGISLADRACLSAARHYRMPALTSDAVWKRLEIGVEVVLFRQPRRRA